MTLSSVRFWGAETAEQPPPHSHGHGQQRQAQDHERALLASFVAVLGCYAHEYHVYICAHIYVYTYVFMYVFTVIYTHKRMYTPLHT